MSTPIYFYYPDASPDDMPSDIDEFAEWQRRLAADNVTLGPSAWTVQTYLHLRKSGFHCQVTREIPDSGVVVAHRSNVPRQISLTPGRYWVCVLADRAPPHPYVNFHILQNPAQYLRTRQTSAYIPHWPQAGLIPRDPDRRDKFENICFFGEHENLDPRLADGDMQRWFSENGLRMQVVARDRWHDYSACDVALAIRTFGTSQWHDSKPATKLVNAWLAGVPAVMGAESAFRMEGRVGLDYLEATSVEDIKLHLVKLASSPSMRRNLVEKGTRSAARFSAEAIATRWIELLEDEVVPRWHRWHRQFLIRSAIAKSVGRIWEGLGWRTELTGSRFKSGSWRH